MLNRALAIAAFVLAAAALTLSLRGGEDDGTSSSGSPTVNADSLARDSELEALVDRLEALEDRTEFLSRRLTALERRPTGDGGTAQVAPETLALEVEQLRTEVRGMVAGEAIHSESGKTLLKELVKETQQELQTERRQEMMERFVEADREAQAGREERWKQFVSDAKLTYTQEQAFLQAMGQESQRRSALIEEVRSGNRNPREVRREVRSLRRSTDEAVGQLLDEAQRARYEQMRDDEWRSQRQQRGGGGGQ